ncbi:MAG: ribosome-associated translation inhibitor RaiA [Dehalococcoidia bacterium]|nr:ribosome-associated translation inhibitor RaiA [Dehalococcoidia bacterium]
MDVVVSGKHAEVGAGLRAHTLEKVQRIERFATDVRRVDVEYRVLAARRADDSHTCEILVHLSRHLVKGQASAPDHPVALDLALEKVEAQMRRLHERRVRRRNGAKVRADGARPAPPGAPDEAEDHAGGPVVRTKRIEVKPMDVEEAALQMELLGHNFFMFYSEDDRRYALLYRRRDGDYGMILPDNAG